LFSELARQVWLVERTSDQNAVLHRRELRRLMLRLMTPDTAARANEIHALAAAYYNGLHDPDLDHPGQRREANYHQAFLGELNVADRDSARAMIRDIGIDIDCVETATSARLKLYAHYELSKDEIATLPVPDRTDYYARAASRQHLAVGHRDSPMDFFYDQIELKARLSLGDAAATHSITPHADMTSINSASETNRYRVVVAFAEGDLQWIAGIAERVVEEMFDERSGKTSVSEGRNLIDSSLWQVALATLVYGDAESWRVRLQSAIPRSKISKQQRSKLGILTAESPLIRACHQDRAVLTRTGIEHQKFGFAPPRQNIFIQDTDQLRALQLLADGRPASSYHVPIQLLRYANPRMKAALEASMSSPNHRHLKEKWQDGWRDLIREGDTVSAVPDRAVRYDNPLFRRLTQESKDCFVG
jgi:hypothetical protein